MSNYSFASYKLMVDLLAVHGIDMPISVNRSTLHRWRVADSVPPDMFRLVYYYACRVINNNDLHIDLLDMLEVCEFSIEGLI